MCILNPVQASEVYDDLSAILEALTLPGPAGCGPCEPDRADRAEVLERRAGYAASMIRAILGTDAGRGVPRSAAELRARLEHPATGCRLPAGPAPVLAA